MKKPAQFVLCRFSVFCVASRSVTAEHFLQEVADRLAFLPRNLLLRRQGWRLAVGHAGWP